MHAATCIPAFITETLNFCGICLFSNTYSKGHRILCVIINTGEEIQRYNFHQ